MQAEGRTHGTAVYPLVEYSVQELYETILSIERESFRFLLEDARRNQEAVRRDLEDPELPLGRLLKQRISGQMTGPLAVSAEAQAYTAAAAGEARMSDLSVPQTTLLSGLVGRVLGGFGKVCMGLAVSLTCLTTAIGIGSTGASVINEVSKGRISYKLWMGIACVVGAVFGSFGIQNIINYVTPIFLIMYPICIVLTVLGLVDKWIPNDGVYKFGVAVAGIVSVGDAILAVAPNLDGLRKVMYMIPLAEQGFSWLIPTVIAMVIGGIVYRGKPRYNYGETAVATEEAAK